MNYGKYKKADGTYFTNENDAAGGFELVASTRNETTKEEKMMYWKNPGSSYKENARGMVFSQKPNAAGLYEGCANSGATNYSFSDGYSIRRSTKEAAVTLVPRGFYHPFANTETNSQPGQTCTVTTPSTTYKYSKACGAQTSSWNGLVATGTDQTTFVTSQVGALFTSQCFKQVATGQYEIDTTKTAGADGFDIIKSGDAKVLSAPPAPTNKLQTDGQGKVTFKNDVTKPTSTITSSGTGTAK